jgi:hypothetical protein
VTDHALGRSLSAKSCILDASDHIFFDVGVKLIWDVNVLTIAKAHVWEVYHHHHQSFFVYNLSFAQIKYFEDIGIKFIIGRAAYAS